MKTIGIICEYNPFHNGHLYHIEKVKELYPESVIILVMSGNVTERGELSLLSKWEKTDIALYYGVDLVIELPYVYASQAADIFCYGSMKILDSIKADIVIFGSESNSIENLIRCAKVQLYDKEYQKYVKSYLDRGLNYPTSLSKALEKITQISISTPNDILGLGYVKEIIKNNYSIEPITIKRTNDYHSKNIKGNISSATSIRNGIINNMDISKSVPKYALPFLKKKLFFLEDYFSFIKYKIVSEINLDIYQTIDEDIIPRMKKYILESNSLEEFLLKIKTKYYTYNKLMRMCSHLLFSFTKEEAKYYFNNPYIRILGFSNVGQKHLNSIKKDIAIPIFSNYSNDKDKLLEIDIRIARILSLLKGEDYANKEYTTKPIKKNE